MKLIKRWQEINGMLIYNPKCSWVLKKRCDYWLLGSRLEW